MTMESDGPLGWSDDGDEFPGVDDVDTTDLSQPDPPHDGAHDSGTPAGDDDAEPEGPDASDDQDESLELRDLADEPQSDDESDDQPPAEPEATSDPVPGSDPDADPVADDPSWASQDPFPPSLELDQPPEPVDGFPWTDPQALGDAPDNGDRPGDAAQPASADDLYSYDGQQPPDNGDAWENLQRSEDPATSTLARFWSR